MNSQLSSNREREVIHKVAPFKESYKLYAVMQVLINKGIVKKEEIKEEYLKVASENLQYFEDEDEKKRDYEILLVRRIKEIIYKLRRIGTISRLKGFGKTGSFLYCLLKN